MPSSSYLYLGLMFFVLAAVLALQGLSSASENVAVGAASFVMVYFVRRDGEKDLAALRKELGRAEEKP